METDDQKASQKNVDQEIEKLLENVAQEKGIRDYKIEKVPGSVKGDGYLGVITAIRITGVDEFKEKKVLDVVVKSALKNEALRDEMPIINVFEGEIYMYNTVIPAFRNFESEKELPPFSSVPKCFKACLIDKSEALILENLKEKGYSLWERRIPMEHDHVRLVMEQFGRFHALSFALRDQKPELFQKLTCNMYDMYQKFFEKGDWIGLYRNRSIEALDTLDPVEHEEARKVFRSFIDNDLSRFLQTLHTLVDNHSVILHGDGWTNNMLFKYDDETKPNKPTKMCFIDLQIARLGSPVLDLSYFLYSCSSEKVLSNFEVYLDVYYNSLSAYLSKLGSNPEELYPYLVFRRQWKEVAKFGLISSLMLIFVMLMEQEEVTDLVDIVESKLNIADAYNYDIGNRKEYNDRVRGIVLHFVNKKFI